MRAWSRLLLPVFAAPLLGSCYFLLDYSDLQSERDKPLASGGASDGGAASGGESAAGGAACGDCDDHDPCTVDTCDAAAACQHTALTGLALDGVDATLKADQHVRVSLVGSGQFFYLADLEQTKNNPKIGLYRLASDGSELEAVGSDLRLEGNPVSNVGLAVEDLAAGEVALHGFVAIKPKVGDAATRVLHVVNRAGKTMTNVASLTATYRTDVPTTFPQARAIGNKVVGAWIQADGTIAVHNVGTTKTDTFGLSTLPANTLALLSTSDEQPAVLFTAQSDAGALGTYVETSGQNRTKVGECETRPGNYVSSSVIDMQVPGVWLTSVTRAGMDYLTTGTGSLLCANNACAAESEDCAKATPSNAVRDVAGATIHFDKDDAGVVYSVIALPQLLPATTDTVTAQLSLALGRVDFSGGLKDAQNMPVGDVAVVAQNTTTEPQGFRGPDWPAVAILPTERVALAWIQPSVDFTSSELRVQRYKMCLPPP